MQFAFDAEQGIFWLGNEAGKFVASLLWASLGQAIMVEYRIMEISGGKESLSQGI